MDVDSDVLGFSRQWYELGIVSDGKLEMYVLRYRSGIDPNPEHYRWGAFREFLENQKTLTDEQLSGLYQLAISDPDLALASSMIHALISRHDVPNTVIDKALGSKVLSVRKKAMKIVSARAGS